MPGRDERGIPIRFTHQQKAWLQEQGQQLDRPMSWIVRKVVQEALDKEAMQRERSTRRVREMAT